MVGASVSVAALPWAMLAVVSPLAEGEKAAADVNKRDVANAVNFISIGSFVVNLF